MMTIERRASKAACRTAPKKEAPSIKTEKRFALSMRQTLALGERIGIVRSGSFRQLKQRFIRPKVLASARVGGALDGGLRATRRRF